MERLTSKKEADRQRRDYEKRLANGYLRNIPEERFLRLADYEDTCLTPAEVRSLWGEWNAMMSVLNSIGSYDRLRELAKADKDGRVTVLPCKVGDTVYFAAWFGTNPHIVKRIIEPYFYTDDVRGGGSTADFPLRDFGKNVFLTREEAEAALKEYAHA